MGVRINKNEDTDKFTKVRSFKQSNNLKLPGLMTFMLA
jgi:hypothetical protein